MNTSLMKKSFRDTGKALRFHRKHILICLLLFIMLIGVMCFCGDDGGYTFEHNDKTYNSKDYSGFITAPFTMLDSIAGETELDKIATLVNVDYDNHKTGVASVLSTPSDTDVLTMSGYSLTSLGKLLRKANGLAIVIALWLLIITWAIGFMNQELKGFQMEEIAKRFLMLAIGMIGVFVAMNLSFLVVNLGSTVAAELATTSGAALDSADISETISNIKYRMISAATKTKGNGFWDNIGPFFTNVGLSIGYTCQFFIPWIINKVSILLVQWTCWSRNFEIIILAVFAPFAFADVIDIHRIGMGSGSRYLKKLGSIALYGAIIIIVVAMGKFIQIEMLASFTDPSVPFGEAAGILGDMALVALATGGLCLKAPSLSKSVLGLG